ncbi:phosphate ABC transporter substrate-binding protein PstS [Paracandidimonas soli]|uniref:phosphate ABC transporter substrate-binding protein PstS n=1 Tax=Paracandidimonas soli TaxID=1917182 RepID=UPI003340538C
MLKSAFQKIAIAAAFSAAALSVQAANITGAGASFPYPLYAKWASEYHKATGNQVNYQSIGSGGGQQQIIARTVDFGATDDPLSGDKLAENKLVQFPAVIGGAVPVVNIRGIEPGALKLSGPVLADIFQGKIKRWNDPAITGLNDGLKLPDADIIIVHRSDGSGTTFLWTNYLSKVSEDWKAKIGEGKAVKWPTGQGGKGNEGVAAYVSQLQNSIGYVEYAYAKQNNLSWTQLQNSAGKFVQPSGEAFAAAAANADWNSAPGMGVVLTNEPGDASWPVTAATFILVPQTQDKPEQGKAVLTFFDWAFKNGAAMATELDYVPLPEAVTNQIRSVWSSEIKDSNGQAVWK